MNSKLFCLWAGLGLLGWGAACEAAEMRDYGHARKKLIHHGKQSETPLPSQIRDNIAELEKRPFDGIVFRMSQPPVAFDPRKPDPARYEEDWEACRAIKWNKFTDNFVGLVVSSGWTFIADLDW